MPFWKSAEEGFSRAFSQGVAGYESIARREDAYQEQLEKQKTELKEKQNSQLALLRLMGHEGEINENTGSVEPIIGASPYNTEDPMVRAGLITQLEAPERTAYKDFQSQIEPEKGVSDIYNLPEYRFNPEKDLYELWGRRKDTGVFEFIADDPNRLPDVEDTFTIRGVTEYEGQRIGKRGNYSQVQLLDNGKVKVIDKGEIGGKGGAEDASTDELDFQYNVAGWDAKAKSLRQRYNRYLMGNFATESERDDYLAGINAEYNLLARKVLKGGNNYVKREAKGIQERAKDIYQERAGGLPPMSTTEFYEYESQKYREDFENGEISYEDFQRLELFLQYKYRDYVEYASPVKVKDEMNVELPELNIEDF